MSSKIISELVAASGVDTDADGHYAEVMPKIADAISELPDDKWNALSDDAADYYNDVSTALNKKKPVPAPSDWEEPKATTRGRAKRGADAEQWEPKVGAVVKLTNTRDQDFIGEILEMDDDTIVMDVAGAEKEFARKRVKSVGPAKAPDAEVSKTPEVVSEPKVGATVTVTNSRDVSYTGKVVEMDDDAIVLEVDGQEKEFIRKKLKACTVAGGAKGKESTKSEDKDDGKSSTKSDAKQPRASKADNGGVSVTGRMRQLICADFDLKVEDVAKQLAKEGLVFRENTLALTFAETHKIIACLRDAGKLKK